MRWQIALRGCARRLGPEDQALLDRLNDTTSQLAQLVLNGPQHMAATDHQKRVKDLQEQRENIEAQISQGSSGSYGASRPITLDRGAIADPSPTPCWLNFRSHIARWI